MSKRDGGANLGGGHGGGVNRSNHGGNNNGKGRGGGGRDGGQTGSNSYVNKSYNARSQTEYSYSKTYSKSAYYSNPTVKLSKSLSNVLRHSALKEGLKIRPDGYVKVEELVSNIKKIFSFLLFFFFVIF
jgi:2'-phosphotransferase